METHQILLYLFISVYVIYSLWVTIKIMRSKFLNVKQKIFNSIATWLIPFIWGLIVSSMIKPVDKSKKRIKSSSTNSDKWRNLTGGGGGLNI